MDLLDRMLGHDYWATTQILEYCRPLSDAQLDREFDIGHRSLRETLDHQIFVLNAWTQQMLGAPAATAREGGRSIVELSELHERYHAQFSEVARRISAEQRLDEMFVDHYDYPQSQGGTIIHVLYHNVLHRSEARHMLERLGVPGLWDLDPQEWEHLQRNGGLEQEQA